MVKTQEQQNEGEGRIGGQKQTCIQVFIGKSVYPHSHSSIKKSGKEMDHCYSNEQNALLSMMDREDVLHGYYMDP